MHRFVSLDLSSLRVWQKALFVIFILGFSNFALAQNCSVNAGLDEDVCANDQVVLRGGAAGKIAGVPMWTLSSGPSVVITNPNDETTSVLGTIPGETYVFTFSALCEDGNQVSQSVTVVIEPITEAVVDPFNDTCPGTYPLTANAPGANETGMWDFPDGNNGLTIADPSSPNTTITLPEGSSSNTKVRWTITNNNGCSSDDDTVVISNEGTVSNITAGPDQTLDNCYTVSTSTGLKGSFAGNNTGTWVFVSGPTNPSIQNANNNNTSVGNLSEGVYTFRWEVNSVCASGSDEVTITVPAGTQDVTDANVSVRNHFFCTPVTQLVLEGNAPQFTGERVQWTQVSGPAGVVFNPDDEPVTLVTGLDGSSTYKFRYQIINDNTGCVSTAGDVQVRYFLDAPTIDVTSPIIEGICGDLEVTIPFTFTGGNKTRWKIESGPYTTNFKNIGGNELTVEFKETGVYELIFLRGTETNGEVVECGFAFDNVTVVVANEPTQSNAGTNQNLACGITETELVANTPTEGGGTWTQVDGPSAAVFENPNDSKSKVTGLVTGVYTFRWLISTELICTDTQGDITVTVSDPNIAVDAGNDQNICANSETLLEGNTPKAGESGLWTVLPQTDSLNIVDATDPMTKVSGFDPNTTYQFTWTVSNECGSVKDVVSIRVDDREGPTPADAGPDQCLVETGGSDITSIQLAGNEITKGRGIWKQVEGPSTLDFVNNRDPLTVANNAVNGQYKLVWKSSELFFNCQTSADTVNISIYAELMANAGVDFSVCAEQFTMAADPLPDGAIGKWVQISGNAGWTVDDITSPTATFSNVLPGQYVFDWEVSGGNGCDSATDEVKILIGRPASTADAGPDQTQASGGALCGVTNYTMQANTPTNGDGVWSLISGPNFPNFTDATDPNMRLTNLITGTYIFRWTISSGTICPAETDDVTLQVAAPVDAGNDVELCDVTEYTLEANQGAVGTWTLESGPGSNPVKLSDNSAIASLIPGNTYTFRFTSDVLFGCSTVFDEVEIIAKGKFTDVPDAGVDQEHCTDDPNLQIFMDGNSTTSAFVDGTWSIIEGPNGHSATFSDVNDPKAEFQNFIAGVYVIEWTFDININTPLSCSVPISDVTKITVYDPGVSNAGPDKTECLFNDSFNLEAVQPAAGIGTWTAISYNGGAVPAGVTINSPNLNTSSVSGITQDGTYVFKWTVNSGAGICPVSEDEVSIFFPPATIAPNAGPDQSVCPPSRSGVTAASLSTTFLDGNIVGSGEWRFVSGPTTPTIVTPTDPRSELTNLDVGTYVLAWYSLSAEATCDRFDEVSIVVNPELSLANAGPDLTFSDSQNIILQASAPSTGQGEWTQASGPSTLTFINKNDPKTGVVGAVTGEYELQWAVSGGNVCGNSTDRMILTVVGTADLSLTKTVDNSTPNIGENVTFTIRLKNDGPDDATGVSIGDVVPFGYQIISVSGSPIVENNNVSWRNLTIPNGDTQTYTLVCTVREYEGLDVYKNQAGVVASDQFDPDSTPANDDGDQSEDDEDAATVFPKEADLSLLISASNTKPKVGDLVTMTIKVTNDGPDDATNVGFGVVTPQGASVGAINDGGFLQSAQVVGWTGQTIKKGQTKTVTYEITILAPTGLSIEYTFFSEVTASDQSDPDSTPNNDIGIQTEDDEDAITLSPQQADLRIEYTGMPAGGSSPNVGDELELTITVNNDGPNTVNAFGLQAYLDNSLQYVAGSASTGGTHQQGVITWDNIQLAGNASIDVTYKVKVLAPQFAGQTFTNSAQIISSDQFDPDSTPNNDTGSQLEDDEDRISYTPQVADVSLQKTVSDYPPGVPQNVFFTIEVLNAGPDEATNLVVRDQLPAGLEYVQDDSGGSYDPATGLWTISKLGVGQSMQLDIEAKVTQFGRLTNVAELIAVDQYDDDSEPGNDILIEDDQDNASVTQEVIVDLSLTKTVDNLTPNVGDNVVFTIDVKNDGPGSASGVSVLDFLASGFTYVSHTGDGTYNRLNGGWLIGDVAVGETKTIAITATVNTTGRYTNSAQVLAQDQIDADSDPGNNVESEDDQEVIELNPVASIDLELTKTVNNATPDACSMVQFTIEVKNLGPSEASGIEVTDVLPDGYTFVSYSSSTGEYNQFTGLWVLDNAIIANESEFLLINAAVKPTGNYLNVAEVTAIDQTDTNLANNRDDIAVVPVDQIDLSLQLNASSLIPFVNEEIDFTIVIANDGCSQATNIEASKLVVSGFTYVSHTASSGTFDSGAGVWDIPQMDAGSSDTLVIKAIVESSGNYQASAEITAADQEDIDSQPNNGVSSEDDTDRAFVFPRALIDLSLTSTVSNAIPLVGEQVTFTTSLIAASGDYSNATNISVSSPIPSGYSVVNTSVDAGAYNVNTGLWNISSLPADSTLVLTVVAEVLTAGDYNLVSEVAQVNEEDFDSTPGNGEESEDDYARVEVTPIELSDLELSSSVTDLSPPVNSNVTIEVLLVNKGPNTATNIVLEDIVPAGLTFQNYTATKGVYGVSSNSWTISSLSTSETARLLITFRVEESNATDAYKYVMEVESADQEDSDSSHGNGQVTEDDYTTLTLTPINQADLSLTKEVDNVQHTVGDFVEFTLTLLNDGPGTATNIIVEDQLPSGYTFVSATGDGAFADSLWTIASLPNNATASLVLRAQVKASGNYLNYAEVISVDQGDPDSTPDNGALDEDDLDFAETGAAGLISISLDKTVDVINPEIGGTVNYTVTVQNGGPSVATGVVVKDLLPTGLNYQSATVDGTYNEVTGSWVIGDIVSGASKTLMIEATVLGAGEYSNIAEVIAHNELDNNSSPNNNDPSEDDQDVVTIIPDRTADLQLVKSVSSDTLDVGSLATFDIVLTNLGPSEASDIEILDLVPNGFVVFTASATSGIYNQEQGTWSISETVAVNGTETLTITTVVTEGSNYINDAEIASSGQADSDLANNSDTARVVAIPVADLNLQLITNDNRPSVQDDMEVKMILTNEGPSTASSIQTRLELPAGLTFVSADPSVEFDENTSLWSLASLAPNATDTLVVTLKVGATVDYQIYAEVSSVTEKDDDSTPGNSSTDEDDDATLTLFPEKLVDIRLSANTANLSPTIADTVTITGQLTNDGPSDASNIVVGFSVTDGFTFTSSTVTNGVYDDLRGTWKIDQLAAGSSIDYTYKAVVNDFGSYNTVFEVLNQTEIDIDSEPQNNDPTEDDQVNLVFTPVKALDLFVVKTVSDATADVGQIIEYTVAIGNAGPSTAQDVIVEDILPSGLDFVASNASTGIYDDNAGLWYLLSDLATNDFQALTIQARIVSSIDANAYENTASVSSYLPANADIDLTNNTASVDITPTPIIELVLNKAASERFPDVGTDIEFTLALENIGFSAASGVQVTDLLKDGFTFVSAQPAADYDETTGIWNVGDLNVNEVKSLVIRATVNPAGTYTNEAEVTAADQEDANSTPNNGDPNEADYASIVISPRQVVDIEVSQAVDQQNQTVGSNVTITVTTINQGPSDASGVVVTDLLPTGLTYVSNTASLGTYNQNTGAWVIGDVPAGQSETLQIVASVEPSGSYNNIAELTGLDQRDIDSSPANNNLQEDDQSELVIVPQESLDLIVTKTASNNAPRVGGLVEFSIVVSNSGPSIATGVEVTDVLSAAFDYVSFNATSGRYDRSTGVWNVNTDLQPGISETLTIIALVRESASHVNSASITAFEPSGADINLANNTSEITLAPVDQIDLELGLTTSNFAPNAGENIDLTLRLSNRGNSTATNVVVAMPVNTGFSFVSANPAAEYNENNGEWTVGTLNIDETKELVVTLQALSTGDFTNVAEVIRADQEDVDSTPGNGDILEDDYASLEIFEQDLVDVSVTMVVDNTTPTTGEEVVYDITVVNDGPSAVTGLVLTSTFGDGLSYLSSRMSEGSFNENVGAWNVGVISAGSTETLSITFRVQSSGSFNHIIQVTSANETDVDSTPANNNSSEDDYAAIDLTPNQSADLMIEKFVSNQTPGIQELVEFVVKVTNNGPSTVDYIEVTDLLPAGLELVGVTSTQGDYNPLTGVWSKNRELRSGQSDNLVIIAKVLESSQPDAYTNNAEITFFSPTGIDPDLSNNATSLTINPVASIDLSLIASIDNPNPNVGEEVTYTLTLKNDGPSTASNIVIDALLPSGLTFISASPTNDYNETSGNWTVAQLAVNEIIQLFIKASVSASGDYSKTFEVQSADQPDLDSTPNNGDQLEDDLGVVSITPVDIVDVEVSVTLSNNAPTVSDRIQATIEVVNNGPSTATNLSLRNFLGSGFSFAGFSASAGNVNGQATIWTLDQLTIGQTETLTVELDVENGGEYIFISELIGLSEEDIDSSPNNGDVAEDDLDFVQVFTIAGALDLSLTKTVTNDQPFIGEFIEFDITVSNDGPSIATNVIVIDQLASGFSFLGYASTNGSYNERTGEWTLNTDLVPGQVEILKIVARVLEVSDPNEYLNTSSINEYLPLNSDSDLSNNTASVTVTPQVQIDLELLKRASDLTPNAGDLVDFTLFVANRGPSTASGVTVEDNLPTGLSFVSAIPSADYNNTNGIWTVGDLAVGDIKRLTITAQVLATGDYTNIAEVASANETDIDSNPGNGVTTEDDYSSVTLFENDLVDVQLDLIVDEFNPLVGNQVTYTITLDNLGPSDASGVTVQLDNAIGLEFISANPSKGAYNSTTKIWNVGGLALNEQPTLDLVFGVRDISPYTLIAQVQTVNENDVDSSPGNNSVLEDDAAVITVEPIRNLDLQLIKVVSNPNPDVGEQIEFDLQVTNTGPSVASSISVTDLLPAGYRFVSANATAGTYNEISGVWSISSFMLAGQVEELKIIVEVVEVGNSNDYINTATISSFLPANSDTDLSNNEASVTINPRNIIDLELSMAIDNDEPTVATDVELVLNLVNKGPSNATNIQVYYPIPSGYEYRSSGVGYDETTGMWSIPILLPDETIQVFIDLFVKTQGDYENTAEVFSVDQEDIDSTPNNGSEDDYATLTPDVKELVDLILTSSVSNVRPSTNEIITITFTIQNRGPSTATNVVVGGLLRDGFTYVNADPDRGFFDPIAAAWAVGTVEVGAENAIQLRLQVRVNPTGSYTLVAEVTSVDQPAVSTPNNLDPNELDITEVDNIIPENLIDLSLSSSVEAVNPLIGDKLLMKYTVNNTSLNEATGVRVRIDIPDGLRFIGASRTFDIDNSEWILGTVTANTAEDLIIEVEVLDLGTSYTTIAEISAADQEDVDSTPNNNDPDEDDYTSLQIDPEASIDLQLEIIGDARPDVGELIQVGVVLTNAGVSVARNIDVAIDIGRGYIIEEINDFVGTYDETTNIWTLNSLAADGVALLELVVTVNSIDDYVICAEVIDADGLDVDSTPGNGLITEDDYICFETFPIISIEIPEGFSPNGDGINDVFRVRNLEVSYPNFRYEIFNRWGEKIYEYTHNGDPETEPQWWDGKSDAGRSTNNNKLSPSATYYYVIHYNDADREPTTGWVYVNY